MTDRSDERTRAPAEHAHWRRNARALAAGNMLINIGWNAAFAFLPLIVQAMGVERNLALWVGAMMFGYYGTSCLFTPVWGVLADYYGRKSMVLRAGFGMALGFAVLSTISDPLGFLCVLVLVGLANGFLPAAPKIEKKGSGACTWCDFRRVCGPYEEIRTRTFSVNLGYFFWK